MKVIECIQARVSQAEFAAMVGISEAAVSQLVTSGALEKGMTAHQFLLAYTARLREQAAGRMGDGGGVDLVTERALLTRSQRYGQDMKNAVANKTYAAIELLTDVLANASQAIVDRFEQVPATLKRQCPDLPQEVFDLVVSTLAGARNEWVRKTESLVMEQLEAAAEAAAIEADDDMPSDPMSSA